MVMGTDDHPILAGSKLIESMRYGGYKNPAYAIAEIIDNSFEAQAKHVELLCEDRINDVNKRSSNRLHKLALIDDGIGMSYDELWNSLTLGRGTRYERRGIGRFGMGLPYASLSQCKRIEIYSWQSSDKIYYTYLDFDEIQQNALNDVPKPELKDIPELWKKSSKILPTGSGTIVVWSKLDRCMWKKSKTITSNSQNLIGRIYRKFIDKKTLHIRMAAVGSSNNSNLDFNVKPNDPMYQMIHSSTPAPWDKKKMFVYDGEKSVVKFTIKDGDGNDQEVVMRFAFAVKDARSPQNGVQAGSQDHGKHASKNLGISVVRGGREINLDQHLLQTYDPLERWWGAEIEFPPALDEFFGITNNKQEATNFSTMTKIVGANSVRDHEVDMTIDETEDKEMFGIVNILATRIRHMRREIKKQEEGRKSKGDNTRHNPSNDANKKRDDEGYVSTTNTQLKTETEGTRTKNLYNSLKDVLDDDEIDLEIKKLIEKKFRVYFMKASWDNSQFFDVSFEGGVQIIKINTNHSAYKNLVSIVEDFSDDLDAETAIKHLNDVRNGLLLLLASWARYEDETLNPDQRKKIANVRFRWGEVLDDYLDK